MPPAITTMPSQNFRTARTKAKGLTQPVCPPAPAVSSTSPSTPAATAFSAWRTEATSASTRQPASFNGFITGSGEPTEVITISGFARSTAARSSATRGLERWTIRLGQNGAAPAVASLISASQASSSAIVRQLAVGKEPITPARQAAITSSGPETRNIGAAINGSLRRCFRPAGSDIRSPQDEQADPEHDQGRGGDAAQAEAFLQH